MFRSLTRSSAARVSLQRLAQTQSSSFKTAAASASQLLRWQSTAAAAAAASSPAPRVGGQWISQLKDENQHIDVVRYEHKNRTWTVGLVDYWSDALAIGFLDVGFLPGDIVLSQMPLHWSETMILQFACSKSGLVLYQLDSEQMVQDPEAGKANLKTALELTKANLLFSPEAHHDTNYIRLTEQVVKELITFDSSEGEVFLSPRFPHLRNAVHTGYTRQDKQGWHRYQHMLVYADPLSDFLRDCKPITGSTPLHGQLEYNPDTQLITGLGPTLTNQQVLEQEVWPTYSKILNKEYHNVEGVGVIF